MVSNDGYFQVRLNFTKKADGIYVETEFEGEGVELEEIQKAFESEVLPELGIISAGFTKPILEYAEEKSNEIQMPNAKI